MTCKSPVMNPLPLREPRKHKETEGLVIAQTLRLLNNVALLRHVHAVQELCAYVSMISHDTENLAHLLFLDVYRPIRVVMAVFSYLTDILVPHPANLLDVCGALGDGLKRVAAQDQLILLRLGDLDIDTRLHHDPANELLANEVTVDTRQSASPFQLVGQETIIVCHPFGFCIFPSQRLLCSHVPDLDLVDALRVLVQVDVDGEMGVDVAHLVLEALGDADDQVVQDGADGAEGGDVLADAVVDVDGNSVGLGLSEANGNVRQVLHQLATGALDGDLASLDVDLDCLRVEKVFVSI